jgi:DNA mismatch repair ATPase MutL
MHSIYLLTYFCYIVNVEPNKTTILFHNKQLIINLVENILNDIYPSKFFQPQMTITKSHDDDDTNMHRQEHDIIDSHVNIVPPNEDELGQNDWSFSMMDQDEQVDELLSDDDNDVLPTDLNEKKGGVTATNKQHKTIPRKRPIDEEQIRTIELPTIVRQPPLPPPPPQHNISSLFHSQQINKPQPTIQQLTDISTLFNRNQQQAMKPILPPRKHRDTSSLFNTTPPVTKNLCKSFNQTISINCNFEEIKSNYAQRKEILTETYHIRIDDYLTMNDYATSESNQITTLLKTPVGLDKHGLSFYTRGNSSTLDKCRHQIYQIGLVKLKP